MASSEVDARFVRYYGELQTECPAGAKPPSSAYGGCIGRLDQMRNLYKSVEHKNHGQVQDGVAYLDALEQSIARWEADEKRAQNDAGQASARADGFRGVRAVADDVIRHLSAARDGKVASTLISFDNRDAIYVAHRLGMLKEGMTKLAELKPKCGKPAAAERELCDLAMKRDVYYARFLTLQFGAILDERLEAWTNTISTMKSEGRVAVINYNKISDAKALAADLGSDLGDIGKALGQKSTDGVIRGRLATLHTDFTAALQAHQNDDAWKAHAGDARYDEPAMAKVASELRPLKIIRVKALVSAWDVEQDAFGNPKARYKGGMYLVKKPGESFCRLYDLTVVQAHEGGGRYGAAHLDGGHVAEFWVSRCN